MSRCRPAVRKVSVVNKPHLSEAIEDRLTHRFGHPFGIEDIRELTAGISPTIQSLEADLPSFLIPLVISQLWLRILASATQNSTSPVRGSTPSGTSASRRPR